MKIGRWKLGWNFGFFMVNLRDVVDSLKTTLYTKDEFYVDIATLKTETMTTIGPFTFLRRN